MKQKFNINLKNMNYNNRSSKSSKSGELMALSSRRVNNIDNKKESINS